MSRNMTKPTKWPVCAQRRLGSDWADAKDLMFLHGDSEDSDPTGRMPRLIGVFAGRTCHIVGFVVTRLTLQTVFILLIIICITFSKIFCPGQNMQQTFLKFVEIYFCLCQKYKIGFLRGKNRNQGKSFLQKTTIAYQNTLSKKNLRKMLLKPYLWRSKLLNQIIWKGSFGNTASTRTEQLYVLSHDRSWGRG